jgi:Ala-tRNA(Pro) deacylase
LIPPFSYTYIRQVKESLLQGMINTEKELLEFLDENGFVYQRVEHPPVYTCAEAERLRPGLPAVSTKNLFLRDKKELHFYLAVTACEKNMDFKQLGRQFGTSKLHFGNEEELARYLGVSRGAVTMLGLVNDTGHQVELWMDGQVWQGQNFLCHPLVNTATLLLSKASLEKFFRLTGHAIHFFEA